MSLLRKLGLQNGQDMAFLIMDQAPDAGEFTWTLRPQVMARFIGIVGEFPLESPRYEYLRSCFRFWAWRRISRHDVQPCQILSHSSRWPESASSMIHEICRANQDSDTNTERVGEGFCEGPVSPFPWIRGFRLRTKMHAGAVDRNRHKNEITRWRSSAGLRTSRSTS